MSQSVKELQEELDMVCERARLRKLGQLDANGEVKPENSAVTETQAAAEGQAPPAEVQEGQAKVEEDKTGSVPVDMEPSAPLEARETPLKIENENENTSEDIKAEDKPGNVEANAPEGSRLCKSTRKNGTPCTLLARSDGYCFIHSPALAEKRKAGRLNGGVNSSKAARLQKLMPQGLGPVNDMLENVLKELYSKKMDARTAQAIANVSRALVAVMSESETEERLCMMEEKIAQLGNK